MVHIYTMEYYSAIKKNKIMPFAATWMDLQSVNSEWSKSDREGEISNDIPYMWNLKRTYFQNRKRLIDLENKLMWEGIVREFGKVMYTCCIQNSKLISNKDILYSTWNSTQCYVPPWMKGGLGKNGHMYMYGWVSSLFPWNCHNIVNGLYPNTK